jgi:hypothetical protein
MSWTLRIEHANGATSTLSVADGETATLAFSDRLDRRPDQAADAEVTVYRDAWSGVQSDLDSSDDKLFIDDPSGTTQFGGRLRDTQRQETTVSVLLDGPKRDALDGKISGPAVSYGPKQDTDILSDIIARTPTVSVGTTDQLKSLSFSEANAAPGKSIAKLAQATGADVVYRSDFTLDYVTRAGSDRTSETLSAATGTIISEPTVRQDKREDVTHVTVLGAGEGEAQVRATASVSSYSASDRRVDRTLRDKDVARQAAAQALADEAVAEVESAPRYLDVEFEVPASVDPTLGDSFTVDLPQYDVDGETLRIVELERLIDEAGDRFRALLSNRNLTRETQGDQSVRELDSLSAGNPGQYFALPVSAGFDRVDSGEPLSFPFPYPENVVEEFRAYIEIDSREYRLPSTATGHDHSVSVSDFTSSQDNAEFSAVVTSASSFSGQTLSQGVWETVGSISPSVTTSQLFGAVSLSNLDSSNDQAFDLRLQNTSTGASIPSSGGVTFQLGPAESSTFVAFDPTDVDGETLEIQVQTLGSDATTAAGVWWIGTGPHDHTVSIGDTSTTSNETAVSPGINTQTNVLPTNVAVEVNGTQVGTVGDFPDSERVDLTGVLQDGSNDIEITTDNLGELRATVFVEGVKNATRN